MLGLARARDSRAHDGPVGARYATGALRTDLPSGSVTGHRRSSGARVRRALVEAALAVNRRDGSSGYDPAALVGTISRRVMRLSRIQNRFGRSTVPPGNTPPKWVY